MGEAMLKGIVFGLCLGLAATAVRASTLTFDELGLADGAALPQSYGDNLPGTPNVTVKYLTGVSMDVAYRSTGFNDLTGVIVNNGSGSTERRLYVQLTADPGFSVQLNSFDIGNSGDAFTIREINAVTLDCEFCAAGPGDVTAFKDVLVPASTNPGHLHYDLAGVVGGSVLLLADLDIADAAKIHQLGFDNIDFSQVTGGPTPTPSPVPLPASLSFLASGLALLGWFRRALA